ELAASPAEQLDYARRVPIADVLAEVFELWGDFYQPRMPTFDIAFSPPERSALAECETVATTVAASTRHLTLQEFHPSPISKAAGRRCARGDRRTEVRHVVKLSNYTVDLTAARFSRCGRSPLR